MTIRIVLLPVCLALAAAGAAWDIKARRIPNWVCLLLALAALAYAWGAAGQSGLLWGAAHAAIALVVGVVLFAWGVIGGGDAKFYAAAALAIPLQQGLTLLGWTSAAGLVLLVVIVIGNRLFAKIRKSLKQLRKMEIPYGVAIAAGFALATLT
jgi:prepilin peptidase CpaA